MNTETAEAKKGIILYQSKYGATKKYAGWLRESLDFTCIEVPKAALDMVKQYDTIVLCGGIYASGIAGLAFLKKHIVQLQDKRTAVFCVGASPYDESALEEIRARNLTGGLRGIPLFYGRGAWDESRMTFWDRILCRMLQKAVAKRDPDTYEPWMKALMCAVGQACDWTDRAYLEPLLDYLKGLKKSIKILFFMQPTPDFVGIYSESGKQSAREKKALGILEAESSIETERHLESGGISSKEFRKAA